MPSVNRDLAIRDAAIRHCRMLASRWGDAVPAAELTKGFLFEGSRVKLVSWGRGIFKPQQLGDGPLTLVSSLASRYDDEHVDGDTMAYDYAPESFGWANEGLKRLASEGRPIILLKQVKAKPASEYMIFAPVAVLGFDDLHRKFRLRLDAAAQDALLPAVPNPSVFSRQYAETVARARLHQAHFRRAILSAYKERCCVCELRERPLLDAAHIVADRLPEGIATVRNGMAMCPTHHRAYDRDVLLVDPDYRVRIRGDRLDDPRGEPTRQVLLAFEGRRISLPADERYRPDPELLRAKLELAVA